MLASPFGEKFHFRTALSLEECQRRIDALEAPILDVTNYSRHPVSARRKYRFTLWENAFNRPPRLTGKLSSNKGWTEVSGRAGANLASLWAAIAVIVLIVALSVYESLLEAGFSDTLAITAVAAFLAAYIYWRLWEDPHAGSLIDYLQHMLEAEPVPGPVIRHSTR